MKIKDIVNREIVNLTNCEHEPIHIPGSIQPHGFLLAFDQKSEIIRYCSGNISDYLGADFEQILQKKVSDVLGDPQMQSVRSYIKVKPRPNRLPLVLKLYHQKFSCSIHISNDVVILEGEPIADAEESTGTFYEQTSRFLSYMEETHTLQQLCQLVAEGTRELTGYDRVMIYRFDKEFNGEVFAESCIESVEPFLGLHYPHTDIPVQARELYMRNLLRLIADISYSPVPIYTVDDGSENTLDLSLSVLRSTSPIHIQYLQNMGVGATLTISLLHEGRLWGLIACHHYSAKTISPEIRLAAQLQGHFITSQIDIRQSNEEYAVARKTNAALEKLSALKLSQTRESLATIVSQREILDVCNASGVAILFDGNIYKSENTPDNAVIWELIKKIPEEVNPFVTEAVSQFLSDQIDCSEVSGIVLHRLGTSGFLIWFRPESLTEIHWAGDPAKAIIKNEKGLSPRNSFALYKETVKCRSKAWLQPEINSAANYAHLLQTHLNLIMLRDEENRNRELNRILQETNSELENINWISTHDLQEPLRKIQLNASKLLTLRSDLPPVFDTGLRRMDVAAKRMQTLLIDIMRYMKLNHIEMESGSVDLNILLKDVLSEVADQAADKNAAIEIKELPTISGNVFLLQQLFVNLLLNAIKYSHPGRTPVIQITYDGRKPYGDSSEKIIYESVTVTDNGIGFEPDFEKSVFKIFTRLQNASQYKGSGVGLALCRKIMTLHKGYIVAKSQPGIFASFTCYFPVHSSS